jgi:hypothetical protein
MGTVRRLAEEVARGLNIALPTLHKTVVNKVAAAGLQQQSTTVQ